MGARVYNYIDVRAYLYRRARQSIDARAYISIMAIVYIERRARLYLWARLYICWRASNHKIGVLVVVVLLTALRAAPNFLSTIVAVSSS